MNYLQKTFKEASDRKSALEHEIRETESRLRELQTEYKGVIHVLRSLEKSIPTNDANRSKTKVIKSDDARTGVRSGSWSEKVVDLLTGSGKLLLREIVEKAITEGKSDNLEKVQVRKRIMNAINSLDRMGVVGIDTEHYNTRYFLITDKR